MAVDTALLGPATSPNAQAMAARMRTVLPGGWFAERGADASSSTPVLDSVLAGQGTAWASVFAQLQAVFAQARLATAAGGALEMISADFFGPAVGRGAGEGDDDYRARIRAALLPSRATRSALGAVLATLSPVDWRVLEPQRVADTGVVSNVTGVHASGGYGVGPTRYGSRSLTFGCLVDGISDSHLSAGTRTDRPTPASLLSANGSMELVAPFVVRVEDGHVLAEPAAWNMIGDSLGWSGFDLGQDTTQGLRASCTVAHSDAALLVGYPVVSCTAGSQRATGPRVTIAAGRGAAVASLWVLVPQDPGCVSVALACQDSGSTLSVAADMTRRGTWQRLQTALAAQASPRQVSMQLELQGQDASTAPVLTQCWQFEPGTTATSYVPSSGAMGFRAADRLSTVTSPRTTTLSVNAIAATIASALPAATRCGVRLIQS